jgi:hypothetical protein
MIRLFGDDATPRPSRAHHDQHHGDMRRELGSNQVARPSAARTAATIRPMPDSEL